MQEVISRSDLVFWLTGYGCILASALGPATGCQPIIPRFRGPTADGTAKWVNIPYIYIYIYTHIYSRHLQYFYVYNYTFFVFTYIYIYILCINIYFYIYIYTYKNIITYIDSYRSASKTLSLGFQVRKKVVFFSWAIWWRHASSGVKILQRLVTVLPLERVPDSVLVWKTFRSYWLIYSSKLFELFSLVNYYN